MKQMLLALTGLAALLQYAQACPMIYMPVCGSDGITYSNECFMRAHAHLQNLTLTVASHGKCAPKLEDICSFPSDTGPCKAAFPRWFYNTKTGGCSQFIYGGCDGNKNNFETREECERKCDSEKTAEYPCFRTLQKVLSREVRSEPVAINNKFHLPQCNKDGYFTHKQCDKSKGECWCVNKLGKEILNTRRKGQEVSCDVCSLPKVVGPCLATIPRWFFNKVSGKCEKFIYGGCQGNANNFEGKEKCQAMCLPHKLRNEKVPSRCENELLEATQKPLLGRFAPRCNPDGSYHLKQCHPSTGFCWCSHPDGTKYPGSEMRGRPDCDKYKSLPAVSTLLAALPEQTKCQKELLEATQKPLFGRFQPRCNPDGSYSLTQCHTPTGFCWCSKPDGTKYPGSEIRGKPDCDKYKLTREVMNLFAALPATPSVDICSLQPVTGPCKAAFPRWFYDTKTGKCSQFIYGGCDGNRNNFRTKEECEKKCDSEKTAEYTCFRALQKSLGLEVLAHDESVSIRKNNYLPQCDKDGYFILKQCDQSVGECWCVNRLGKEILHTRRKGHDVNCDVCSLPKVVGPCRAAFPRWFFNKASGKCEKFIYGGCQGNANNFEGKEKCQAMCVPHKLRFHKVPTTCQQEVFEATQKPSVGRFTPRCNPDSSYHLLQCHASTGFCWCSHPDGYRYPGSEARGVPNCEKYVSLPEVKSLVADEPVLEAPFNTSKKESVVEASFQETGNINSASPKTSGNEAAIIAVTACAALCIVIVAVVLMVKRRRGHAVYNKLVETSFDSIAGEKTPLVKA